MAMSEQSIEEYTENTMSPQDVADVTAWIMKLE